MQYSRVLGLQDVRRGPRDPGPGGGGPPVHQHRLQGSGKAEVEQHELFRMPYFVHILKFLFASSTKLMGIKHIYI